MNDYLPLCLIRIWCRTNDSWLSFKTVNKDRFLVNPAGYFIELPDGSLSLISPRVTFPVSENFPAISIDTLTIRSQYGDDARFVSVPMVVEKEMEPVKVDIDSLQEDPLLALELPDTLSNRERYVLCRALEAGLVSKSGFSKLLELRSRFKTIGSALIYGGICQWEPFLAYCLDTRPLSSLDPPPLRNILQNREWELIGEILVAMGKIRRTHLEFAVKLKRDGGQPIGQILLAAGACKETDVERALKIQQALRQPPGEDIALIGKLLVTQGYVTESDLEDALRNQRIARQPLAKILINMGHCAQRDVDGFAKVSGISFQADINDVSLGDYLVKTDTITKIHLEEALRIQRRGRQVLGELLVQSGSCNQQEVDDCVVMQREIREAHRQGVEKIGSILINIARLDPARIEEAVKLQNIGRQPFGAILAAMGFCSDADVMQALELQKNWREQEKGTNDRLGEVLVKQGVISEDDLRQPLLEQSAVEKPLGRILVEKHVCTPEQIVEALIDRDFHRRSEFLNYVRQISGGGSSSETTSGAQQQQQAEPQKMDGKKSIVDKLQSWFSRPKEKP